MRVQASGQVPICDMTDGQQIFLHPYWISDAKTLLGRNACDGGVFRIQSEAASICLVLDQDAVICHANAGNLKPPLVNVRKAQRASLRLIWFDT